ncbi:MAG: GAF domain-containing protein [Clostridia bacterium]
MHEVEPLNVLTDKQGLYRLLYAQLCALMENEPEPLPNMANMSALLFYALPDVNWVGFYLFKNDELLLGPFQGKPACIRIPMGRGVCGTAAATKKPQLVPDVHAFAGHIACDAQSMSELVIPLVHEGRLLGVLDADSPIPARFDEEDLAGLTALAAQLINGCHWQGFTQSVFLPPAPR